MANVREYIRINPLDTDNRRAVGVRFPFNAEGVFFSTFTTAEQVKSNLLNVILTEPFASGAPMPMDTTGMPTEVANAVTRDYSGLMKAIDKKKGK